MLESLNIYLYIYILVSRKSYIHKAAMSRSMNELTDLIVAQSHSILWQPSTDQIIAAKFD